MKRLIDKEVKRIIKETYERTKDLISQNMDKLENLAKALLERETLTGEEIDKAMRGELKSTSSDSGSQPPAGLEKEEKKMAIEDIPPGLNPQLEV